MATVLAFVMALLPGVIAEWRRHKYSLLVSILGFATAWISVFLWAIVVFWAVVGDRE